MADEADLQEGCLSRAISGLIDSGLEARACARGARIARNGWGRRAFVGQLSKFPVGLPQRAGDLVSQTVAHKAHASVAFEELGSADVNSTGWNGDVV